MSICKQFNLSLLRPANGATAKIWDNLAELLSAWVAQLVERRIQKTAEVGGSTPLLAFFFLTNFILLGY